MKIINRSRLTATSLLGVSHFKRCAEVSRYIRTNSSPDMLWRVVTSFNDRIFKTYEQKKKGRRGFVGAAWVLRTVFDIGAKARVRGGLGGLHPTGNAYLLVSGWQTSQIQTHI